MSYHTTKPMKVLRAACPCGFDITAIDRTQYLTDLRRHQERCRQGVTLWSFQSDYQPPLIEGSHQLVMDLFS